MTSDLSINSGVKVNIILSGNNSQLFYRQNAGGSDNTVLSFDWGGGVGGGLSNCILQSGALRERRSVINSAFRYKNSQGKMSDRM